MPRLRVEHLYALKPGFDDIILDAAASWATLAKCSGVSYTTLKRMRRTGQVRETTARKIAVGWAGLAETDVSTALERLFVHVPLGLQRAIVKHNRSIVSIDKVSAA
jgi:hypothetical protein